MERNQRARLLLVLVAAVCTVAVLGIAWYRSRPYSTEVMFRHMPVRNSVTMYFDLEAMRRAGILQLLDGSKFGEDPDYRVFVNKINFDYQNDLDGLMISFNPSGKYFLAKGRFDWRSLRSYAIEQGGECYVAHCKIAGSTHDRRISFAPLQKNVLALAVSPDDGAVQRLTGVWSGSMPEIPNAPIWLSVPGSLLKSQDSLPDGTRMFARTLERAQDLKISILPEGDRFAAKLDVMCQSDADAAEMVKELTRLTTVVRESIEREQHKPNPADISGPLSNGTFQNSGSRVTGHWPIDRALLTSMLGAS